MAKRDYYEVLGVGRTASAGEIKRAYRKLARTHHPDVSKDSDAEAKFKEVQEAYDVLSDPKKRQMYDRFGSAAFDGTTGGAGPHAWTWTRSCSPFGHGGGGGIDLGDILEQMFGGGAPRRGRRRGAGAADPFAGFAGVAAPPAGRVVVQEVHLSFEQAVHGTKLEVAVHRPVGRAGAAGGRQRFAVTIPAGVSDGGKVRLRGRGEPGPPGAPPGDLILVTRVAKHPFFQRDGDRITLDVPVTIAEALEGARIEVPTVDGPTTLKLPKGVRGGQKLRLRGKGVPHRKGGGRGDQYVRIQIAVPPDGGPDVLEAVKRLSEATGNPREGLW